MTTHIDNETSHAAWVLHAKLTQEYYKALESIQSMQALSFVLKKILNGKKRSEQISEDMFDKISQTHKDFDALYLTWKLFDNEGFKEKYEADEARA